MGYITLDRKFFETEYWEQERSFSFAEAWLDLIQMARYKQNPGRVTLKNGREIVVKRGEIFAGLRYLSQRWSWSLGKTKRFIDKCVKKQQVERRTEQGIGILVICNYDKFNPVNFPRGTLPGTVVDTLPGTVVDTLPGTEQKEGEEGKEGKTTPLNPPRGRPAPTGKRRFKPPSLEEVTAYCQERGNSVDPQRWFDYYTANGFMVGKVKMKDWKATVRTWERNEKGGRNGGNQGRTGFAEPQERTYEDWLR